MLKSFIRIAWRNLRKNKMYTTVNLLGLTIGIVSCILIALYVFHELSFDRFHTNGDRIARVTMEYGGDGSLTTTAVTGTKPGPQFKRSFPAVESFARTYVTPRVVANGEKAFTEQKFMFADPALFSMFSFPLLQGNPATALDTKDKIVITESMAHKYFGATDVIGKTLRIGKQRTFEITAVAADVPGNSQIPFDFVISFENMAAPGAEEWWTANYITYLMVQQPEQIASLQQQITAFMKTPQVRKEAGFENSLGYLTYHLEPLYSVHLHSKLPGFVPNGNITYIYILSAIALLILIIACINYTNLSTAQAAGRTGEISIRKVLGAEKRSLFLQHMGESVLLTGIALIAGVLISAQLLPLFNNVTGKTLSAGVLFQPLALGGMLLLGIIVSLLAGSYPALVLSHTKLQHLLRSGFTIASSGGNVRKSLIVFQFAISAFLMVATFVILQQLSYIQHKSLGYDKEQVMVVPVDYSMLANYDDLKAAIRRHPAVVNVAGAYESPTFIEWGDGITTSNDPAAKSLTITALPADLDFVKTMGIQLRTGADFSPADLALQDTSNNYQHYQHSFLLNETAVRKLGWTPEEAVGKIIYKGAPGIVKGVIKDFHFSSLHEPIGPLAIFLGPQFVNQLFVKIRGNQVQASVAHLQGVFKERAPHRPFDYHFLDEEYDTMYKGESQTAGIFATFSGIAILLACLGLFALAAFTTVQRTKEIGIRKVLGASVFNLVQLISKDFLKLVLIACLIAFPLAWWASSKWLQDFAFRIHLSWWMFAAVALAATAIALLSVGMQALRAATANPVKSLKSE